MPSKRVRIFKAFLMALAWVLLRVPMDLVLIRAEHSDIAAFAVTIQAFDLVVATYFIFKIMQCSMHRPWKCPACDGWGRRAYFHGISEEMKKQLNCCGACDGTGIVWEQITGGQL